MSAQEWQHLCGTMKDAIFTENTGVWKIGTLTGGKRNCNGKT